MTGHSRSPEVTYLYQHPHRKALGVWADAPWESMVPLMWGRGMGNILMPTESADLGQQQMF